ncbi:hypothetical protein BGZ83_005320, partial [Gryganskiella cystojenkinii]
YQQQTSGESYVMRLGRVHSSSFLAAYNKNALQPGQEYTIAAAGLADFRVGKSLTALWEAWRGKYRDDRGAVLIHKIPRMTFVAVAKVK